MWRELWIFLEMAYSRISYNSSFVQVCLLGIICFCCPGMFNALTAMGGGGQLDPSAADDANTALYTTFAFSGLLSGAVYNLLGLRLTLFSGCSTYILYTLSFLFYNHHHHNHTLLLFSGAILGIGAAMLWTAHGAVITSYPLPSQKGSFISLFWTIFNLGGVLGGLIPLLLNLRRPSTAAVTDSTYIVFAGVMAAGAALSLGMLQQRCVVRGDGSHCLDVKRSSFRKEGKEIVKVLGDWRMQLIAPAAWASNFFYSYQFNVVNGVLFNVRSRGFNNVFYWGAQMVGSVGIGYILDYSCRRRRRRGFVGIGVVGVFGMAVWGGGLALQLTYSENDLPEKLDFVNSGRRFVGPFVVYLCYGLMDAMFQSLVYWVIGCLTDDGEMLSRYCGFYKGVQSGGAAVAWQLGKGRLSFLAQVIVNWSLVMVSIPLLALVVLFGVDDGDGGGDDDCNGRRTW